MAELGGGTRTVFDVYRHYKLVAVCEATALLKWFPDGLHDATLGFCSLTEPYGARDLPGGWYCVRRFVQ
jgi:hypothetical protein